MADEAITVLARLKAKDGIEEKVKEECILLVEPTRHEAGCISYDFHQCGDDPSLFMFTERWRSREDLDNHINKPHLQRFMALAEGFLAEPLDVTIWTKLS